MTNRLFLYWLIGASILLGPPPGVFDSLDCAMAYPNGPAEFCARYPNTPLCAPMKPDCGLCHTSSSGGSRNPYGDCLQKSGFISDIEGSLAATEQKDCDKDGVNSLDEIIAGTFPGNAASKPATQTTSNNGTPEVSCDEKNELSDWNVCGFDALHAFRKVKIDFCRNAASISDIDSFKTLPPADQMSSLHQALDSCLVSEKWIGKDGVLWRLGHSIISPVQTLKSGENVGTIPLGDYDDDYALWVYYNMAGRDVRGVLTAQHFVTYESNPSQYSLVDEMPLHPKASGVPQLVEMFQQTGTQQFVPKSQRAGLLTTNWTLVSRTMFTSTPRAAANVALRAFLGIDIAKGQGLADLYPEDPNFALVDFDSKGVLTKECAFCHEALDPVTYPFTEYNGLTVALDSNALLGLFVSAIFNGAQRDCGKIDTSNLSIGLTGDLTQIDCYLSKVPSATLNGFINNPKVMLPSTYKAERIDILAAANAATEPELAKTPTAGYLFGEPVADLVEWADTAANSDAFAKRMVMNYWILLVGREPSNSDKKDFDSLWQNLKKKHNYSVNAMLHELIETEVYGAP